MKHEISKLKILFTGTGLGLLFLFLPLTAETVASGSNFLEVSPAVFRLQAEAGGVIVKTLKIKNQGAEPLIYRVGLAPLKGDGWAGNFKELDNWVSFDDEREAFLLPAFSEKFLRFTARVPNTAAPGGYYGRLKLEPLISQAAKGALRVVPVFSVPLLVDVMFPEGVQQRVSLVLENLELENKTNWRPLEFVFNKIFRVPEAYAANPLVLAETLPFKFRVALKNTGQFLIHAGGRLKIFDSRGIELAAKNFSEIPLLPAERKVLDVEAGLEAKRPFWFFIYPQRLKAVVEVPGSKEEFFFWVFSWKKSLTVVLLVLCSFALFCWRKRFLAALTALLRA